MKIKKSNKLLLIIGFVGVAAVAFCIFTTQKVKHANNSKNSVNDLFEQSQQISKTTGLMDKDGEIRLKAIHQKMVELLEGTDKEYFVKGYAYYKLGDNDKSLDLFTRALQLNSKDVLAHIFLAKTYRRLKEYDKALQEMSVAEKINKQNSNEALIDETYGFIFSSLKEYEKAISYFNKSIEVDSVNLPAFEALINTYFNQQNYKKLLEVCQKANTYFPNEWLIIYNSGVAYNQLGQHEEALKVFQKIYDGPQEDIYRADLLTEMAFSYFQLKDYKQAKNFAEEAMKLNPDNKRAKKFKLLLPLMDGTVSVDNNNRIISNLPTPKSKICLQNGSCLEGVNVVKENNGYWLNMVDGKIFFRNSEVAAISKASEKELEEYNKQKGAIEEIKTEVKSTADKIKTKNETELRSFLKDYDFEIKQVFYAGQSYSLSSEQADAIEALKKGNDWLIELKIRAYATDTVRRVNYCYKNRKVLEPDIIRLILRGNVKFGMKKEEVEASIGSPKSINRTVHPEGVHEQWVYSENVFVYFENERCVPRATFTTSFAEPLPLISANLYQQFR